jgi:hypothetical protein
MGRKPKFDYLGTFLMIAAFALTIYGASGAFSCPRALLHQALADEASRLTKMATSAAGEIFVHQSAHDLQKPTYLACFLSSVRDTAESLAPLLIGAALFPAFILWERQMDPYDALIDPKIWRIRNVILIAVVSLLPYFWCARMLHVDGVTPC